MKKALILLFASLVLHANEAEEIIRKVDHNMRGKTLYVKMKMIVQTAHHTRSMELESWSEGKKKNFVKVLAPSKEYGITFLSLDGQMWQYVPKIERIIKIPPSMMLQKWMGSDITNDDVVKQSSIVDDYTPKLLGKKGKIATILLIPKPQATVVWGKIVTQIDTRTYTSVQEVYYDQEGTKVRVFDYANVKQYGKYYLPTLWKVKPFDAPGHLTTIKIEDAMYDAPIDPAYFSLSALKRFSN